MTQTQDTHETQATRSSQSAGKTDEEIARLVMATESLLFVAGRPLEYTELRKLLDIDDTRLIHVLETLSRQLENQGRGIRVQRLGSQVQLVTAPENARYIAALLGLPMTAKLTSAALETLAVIAYRQPMTRAQIEAVRGVNSDRALVSLIQHSLVAEVGRAPTVGRPALFATTAEFLHLFGLTALSELPHLDQTALDGQNGHQLTQLPMPGLDTASAEAASPEIPVTAPLPEPVPPDMPTTLLAVAAFEQSDRDASALATALPERPDMEDHAH